MSKKTPLYDAHLSLRGKIVDFGGWSLPVTYSTVVAEHQAVRTKAGLFDVSHMGEILVSGRGAEGFLQYLTVNDLKLLALGAAQYNAFCNADGMILDDVVIYRTSLDSFLICANASNVQKILQWVQEQAPKQGVRIEDLSASYGQIAIQGPESLAILAQACDTQISALPYYRFTEAKIFGVPALVSRTGYTGERGYELYLPTEATEKIWNALLEVGKPLGLVPCGLGARDTLRLEAGYLLYGSDMDESCSALACGLGWIIKWDKGDFVGKTALSAEKEKGGPAQKLVGFEMQDKAIGRHGYAVENEAGERIGVVTSGAPAPSLGKNVGFAYVDSAYAKASQPIFVRVRQECKPARVVIPKTFYKNPLTSA